MGDAAQLQCDVADGHGPLRKDRSELPPDHQPNQVRPAHVRTRHRGDRLTIAKDRDAIGNGDDLLEPMRDVDDPRAAATQPLDDPEQLLCLSLGERRRRFVHDQNLRFRSERLGDFHHLLLGHAERLDQAIGPDRRADARQEIRRQACARPPVHASPRVAALERQCDVLGDGEVGKERGLLVDGRDPQGSRDGGRHAGHGLTRHHERPRVRRDRAGDHFDQGALAGAVLADERVHLSGMEIERHPL